jgi:hypothetical protein
VGFGGLGISILRLRSQPCRSSQRYSSANALGGGVTLELHPSPDARRGAAIEIVLSSGVTLRVAETIEPAALARLVAALERGC